MIFSYVTPVWLSSVKVRQTRWKHIYQRRISKGCRDVHRKAEKVWNLASYLSYINPFSEDCTNKYSVLGNPSVIVHILNL